MKHFPTLERPWSSRVVVERVHVAFEQRQVGVHPGAEVARERLGHERRVHAVVGGDLLHHVAERDHVVGHRERVAVAQVDLVLARSELVMAVLDGDPHRLERHDRLLAQVGHLLELGDVEEPGVVERLGGVRRREVEELHLGAGVEREALLPGPLQVALQDEARVTLEGLVRDAQHVAEDARRQGVIPVPGHDHERVGVGLEQHVRLLDTAVALDRRPVEGHALLEGDLELGGGDLEALQEPEDVGEPQPHEADAALLDGAQHVVELVLHLGNCGRPVRGAPPRMRGAKVLFTRHSRTRMGPVTPGVTASGVKSRRAAAVGPGGIADRNGGYVGGEP